MKDQDTEITLGTGRLLGLFFGLVLLCAVFFSLGYGLGRKAAAPPVPIAGGETITIDGGANGVKPAAVGQVTPSKPDCAATPEGCGEANAAAAPAEDGNGKSAETGESAGEAAPVAEQSATIAPPEIVKPGMGYIVQVAAVSKQQDAEALVEALKKKQYAVFIAMAGSDNLFHVQIGPFSEQKDAEAIRSRLVADGYNPIVKK
ncbi:MAG: SPOR domain-containing protein [Terriglobales bacterium]